MPARLTERDREIVLAVYHHRALTSDQLALLFWGDVKANSRCRMRLRFLAERKYLQRFDLPVARGAGSLPLVYFLGQAGAEMIADLHAVPPGELHWKPEHNRVGWTFLEHLLATNDVRVRIERSAPIYGFQLAEWLDDASLASVSARETGLIMASSSRRRKSYPTPDGYFCLCREDSPKLHRAFVEADRGTESLARWSEKIAKYVRYLHSDDFKQAYHARKPFRVLTVTTSAARMAHLKAVTEKLAGTTNWFWFSTFEAIREPGSILLRPVWQMAGTQTSVCFPYPPADIDLAA